MTPVARSGVLWSLVATLLVLPGMAQQARAALPVVGPKIVNGVPTTTAENPWQAQLEIAGTYLCGGELISPIVVLTAAHCLQEAHHRADQVQVTLGRDRTDRGGLTQTAVAMVIDPAFDKKHLNGDWGYVVLATPTDFAPIQLAGPDEAALWAAGRRASVTGYGTISERGPLSRMLRSVNVPILDDSVCRRPASYGAGFDPATMICAGDPEARKDSCQGDSGGPMVVRADDGSQRLAGIVSFGRGCAEPGFPGVYTRIASPAVNAALLAALEAQPETAGYPYVGTGGACVTATRASTLAAHRSRHADRTLVRATHRLRHAHTPEGLRRARAAVRGDRQLAARAQHDADRASKQATAACG